MSTRKNLPSRIEVRRKAALDRRIADLTKHIASGDTDKADKAKADVGGLKKKLGLTA
jgi:hypothetical protein